jgi:hypothetical protein
MVAQVACMEAAEEVVHVLTTASTAAQVAMAVQVFV